MKAIYITISAFLLAIMYAFTEDGMVNKSWYDNANAPSHTYGPVFIYDVHGIYTLPVKKRKLQDAKLISDINTGYPVNWIEEYISTEIKVVNNNKVSKATGKNNILSPEQKNLIRTADLGTNVEVNIDYKYKNDATGIPETSSVHFSSTVVPEREAAFSGGQQKLRKYIELNALNNIRGNSNGEIQKTVIRFTIDEKGKTINTHVYRSSQIDEIDQELLNTINKMPEWIPAKNEEGKNVPQDFELVIENGGC
jgi:hypothetical protein